MKKHSNGTTCVCGYYDKYRNYCSQYNRECATTPEERHDCYESELEMEAVNMYDNTEF